MPIEGVVLQLKSMNIDHVANFPFPTSPDRLALKVAEHLLVHLGALNPTDKKISVLGTMMALIPVAPRFSKMYVIMLYEISLFVEGTIVVN
jgi:ATP-dependent RNA helicase DHX37/DHR1